MGTATPVLFAVIGALASTATSMSIKQGMKGDAYGGEEVAVDVAQGTAEALLNVATAGWGEGMLKALAANIPALQALARAAETGLLARLANKGLESGIEGALQGLPSGAWAAMLDESTWSSADPLAIISKASFASAAQGGAMGAVMGAGFDVALGGAPHPPGAKPGTPDPVVARAATPDAPVVHAPAPDTPVVPEAALLKPPAPDAPVVKPATPDTPVVKPTPTDAPVLKPTPTDAPAVKPTPTDAPDLKPTPDTPDAPGVHRTAPDTTVHPPEVVEAVGGVMGTDTYGRSVPAKPGDQPHTLKPGKVREKIKQDIVKGAAPWSVEGTTMTHLNDPAPDATNLKYELNVPRAPDPEPTAGPHAGAQPDPTKLLVDVEVKLLAPDKLSAGAHPTPGGGSAAGPGRVTLKAPVPPDTRWKAEIELDNTLLAENIRYVVGHEVDEVSRIVRKYPDGASVAEIDAEMHAAIASRTPTAGPDGVVLATAHDDASAVELLELTRRHATTNDPEEKAALGMSIEKLSHHMALDDLTNVGAKLALLTERGPLLRTASEVEWRKTIDRIRTLAADAAVARATALSTGGALPATSALKEGKFPTKHLVTPEAHVDDPNLRGVEAFEKEGLYGGHDDDALKGWVANSERGYGLVPRASNASPDAGYTVFSYDQYVWVGAGPAPKFPKPGDPISANWRISSQPKTTVSDIGAFIKDVDVALTQAYPGGLPDTKTKATLSLPGNVTATVIIHNGRITSCWPDPPITHPPMTQVADASD